MKPKQQKNIIDFGALESYIKKFEAMFQEDGINITEQELILNSLLHRIVQKRQNVAAQDMMQNISIGELMGRIMKKVGNNEEKD